MTQMSSRPIQASVAFAQSTQPTVTIDGVFWIDTSQPKRPTSVYSSETEEWEPLAVNDYSQLENTPDTTAQSSQGLDGGFQVVNEGGTVEHPGWWCDGARFRDDNFNDTTFTVYDEDDNIISQETLGDSNPEIKTVNFEPVRVFKTETPESSGEPTLSLNIMQMPPHAHEIA